MTSVAFWKVLQFALISASWLFTVCQEAAGFTCGVWKHVNPHGDLRQQTVEKETKIQHNLYKHWSWCVSLSLCHRIEYDAYRTDLEELNLGPRDATTLPKIEQSQIQFQMQREKYEKMRNDVSIKLKFLEENKVITNAQEKYFIPWKILEEKECIHEWNGFSGEIVSAVETPSLI